MTDDRAWEDPIWRGRFQSYSPRELVDFANRCTGSSTAKIALEVLDQKLIAMGCKPTAQEQARQDHPAEAPPVPEGDAAK